ncbi:MAG: FGGY family carbohydrate kinase [Kiloniellales bacterium]
MASVLAIDLGGSALKACLFDLEGRQLASTSHPLGFAEDKGRSEQDPGVWWQALLEAATSLSAKAPDAFDSLTAIATCGFTRTQIFLDAGGKALRPAIGFRDSRAQALAEELCRLPGVERQREAKHLNGFHPLARLAWLQREEPEVWQATRLLLEPKDYLNLRLTGQAASDPVSQERLLRATAGGADSLAAAVGLESVPLPPLIAPTQEVGRVQQGLPQPLAKLAGARVYCGANDSWTAAAGLAALKPGRAYCLSGSSEVFGLLANTEAQAPGLIALLWGEGLWHLGGPGMNGANALDWIVNLLDPRALPSDERLESLLAAPCSGLPLLCHPYLLGERVPFWDPDLRASFIGLSARHQPGDLVRAVMEGVAFLNRLVLERAETASGQRTPAVRLAGGGSRNAAWNQIRANCLGRPLLVSSQGEMGLAGCLAVTRVGLGLDPDVVNAAEAIAGDLVTYDPDPAFQARADALYAVFKEMQESLAGASHRLARIGEAAER